MSRLRVESEEILDFFLCLADSVYRPMGALLKGAPEPGSWRRLHRSGHLERERDGDHWVWRLTEKGRAAAAGGVDPSARWDRPWDGNWRMLLFDLPANKRTERVRLWRWLRKNRLGMLQRSVWITPDPMPDMGPQLQWLLETPGSVTLFEGRPAVLSAGGDDAVTREAWDFDAINDAYRRYLEVLRTRPGNEEFSSVREWKAREFGAWRTAVASDPLLPRKLHPRDYLGCKAWDARLASRG